MTTLTETIAAVEAAKEAIAAALADFDTQRDSATLNQVQQLAIATAGAMSSAQALNDAASTRMVELEFNAAQETG